MKTILVVSQDDESAKKVLKLEINTCKDRQKSWLSSAGESMGLREEEVEEN